MENFTFRLSTKLIFGRDEHKNIGAYLKQELPGLRKLLLHYGGGSIKRSGVYDEIIASLRGAGIDFVELGGVVPNPRVSLVYEGIELCRREGAELVLAVGGGSAIDSAKAIALGVRCEGDVWRLYREKTPAPGALPVATILTIPAAGSESSDVSVINNEAEQLKIGYHDEALRPILSVVNPALFATLPKDQIANGVADIISHIFERYFTHTAHTDVTDELCEGVLRAVMKNAPLVLADPENFDAWSEIGFAGTLAHNGLLGRGRQECWGCHGLEHELSAVYDVAHGAGLAVLTPYWMEYVWRLNVPLFEQFARNVMGVAGGRDAQANIAEAIARLRQFFKRLGLPGTLTELGIGPERLEE
ncbi:MAG: iron-containing alcohol dehydrogenase, partial [Firmicutes bacterium]|nr:iron-containing alcohol dehydrogenase [Bacillota bacterium]